MDPEEKDATDRGSIIGEDETSSLQEPARIRCTDRIGVARGQSVIHDAIHRGSLVRSLATVKGQLTSLDVGQFPVLVTDTEEDLVSLGRVNDVVAYCNPDDSDLTPMPAMVRFDDVHPRGHDRFGVVQRHLLEIVETFRGHAIDLAVRCTDDEHPTLGVREGDGRLRRLLRGDTPTLAFKPLGFRQAEEPFGDLLGR